MLLKNQKGSALYTVLILSTAAVVLLLIYIKTQYSFSGPSIRKAHSLQALLNARSGIWYGLDLIESSMENSFSGDDEKSSKAINDSLFTAGLFDDENDSLGSNSSIDSIVEVVPFDSSFGSFTLNIEKDDFYITLKSQGKMRSASSNIEAQIASRPFSNSDTVLFLETVSPVKGIGYIEGRTAFSKKSIDSSTVNSDRRFFVDRKGIKEFVSSFNEALSENNDTALMQMPVNVFYEDEFERIDDTIRGSLFFDGTSRDLIINGNNRTIIVQEELQFTGTVQLKDITFIVAGDVKLLDETYLKDITIYSKSRIFIGNESRYDGTAISDGVIEIYDEASVENRSLFLSMGSGVSKPKPVAKPDSTNASTDSLTTRLFAVNVRDKSTVDGILIDMSKSAGGISTSKDAVLRGVLWSEGTVCHRGELEGVIKAKVLVDDDHLTATSENFMEGDVKIFQGMEHYLFPIYFGRPVLIDWREL